LKILVYFCSRFIKKGGGIWPYETLATCTALKSVKVLIPTRYGEDEKSQHSDSNSISWSLLSLRMRSAGIFMI